ncbi:MAG TPA: L,D-transpeptidase [Kofleriaceae bacterium]|jgi:lipoprotein-anchoring transpeptidase ErfK/SrfK
MRALLAALIALTPSLVAAKTMTGTPLETAPDDVVEMTKKTVLLAAPHSDADKLGIIKEGTRVAVIGTAEVADKQCANWLELAPRGWTCATATMPTNQAPTTAASITLDDDMSAPIRATYGMVRRGSLAFASRADVASGEGREMSGSNVVRARGATMVDGKRYWITQRGELVDASRIYALNPSEFKGTVIAVGDAMPSWTVGTKTVVAAITAPPPGTGESEKWFDVDLDSQILVAYEGTRPVYATLVSTGRYKHETKTVIARIESKHETAPMTSDKEGETYSVADVPWTMFYDGDFALHTAYWHGRFGRPMSHGCVNLAPRDARVLFAWSSPDVPAGWSSVYGSEEHPGSLVRIHSAKRAAPRFTGYAKTLHEGQSVAAR